MALRLPRPSPKLWLALIVLLLGAALALIDQRDSSTLSPVPSDAAGEPDYYLEGARLTRFDAEGNAYQRLKTPHLVHTPSDDVTRAETPRVRLYDSEERTWFAQGDEGTLGAGGRILTLTGNARLEAPKEGWQLDTEVLVYDSDTSHAWSESEAVLRQHQQRIRGERFDAWINEGRSRLSESVRGFHPPTSEERGS